MNYLDLLVLVALAAFGFLGYRRGLIREAVDLLILTLSLGFAVGMFVGFSRILVNFISLPETFVRAAAFFVIWFIVELILYTFAIFLLGRVPQKLDDSRWNRWGGTVLSVIKSTVIIGLIIVTLLILPLGKDISSDIQGSASGKAVDKLTPTVEKIFENTFGEVANNLSRFATVNSGTNDKVDLGYKLSNPAEDMPSASEMLKLINIEREKAGLRELSLDDKLSSVASGHAKDMFAKGYISHISLEGKTPFDRMKEGGINSFFAGENLALAADVEAAMTGLMSSAGHKANILSGDYAKVGISVYDGGVRGRIFVQEFTD